MTTRGRLLSGPALALALAAAGCLTASQESRLATDVADVRTKIFEMQKDTAAVLQRLASVEEAVTRQQSAGPTRFADLQALIQTLTDEVRTLGARLDDNTARMSALSREVAAARDQYRVLDARLAAFVATQGGGPAPGAPAAPGQAGTGTEPGTAAPPSAGPAGAPPTSPGPAPASPGAPAPQDEASQEEVFRAAYTDYMRGNYDAAISGFGDFLQRYPESLLAGNAVYYTGECLFSQQRYQEAADAFDRAITEHPSADKTPAAYLKKGLSLLALKQTAQGVVQLQHVIEAYPRSEEARIAADRLRQLGLRDR